MSDIDQELIQSMNQHPYFSEFKEWVLRKINELDSVDGLEEMSNKQAGEEARVRLKSRTKLFEIMEPFLNIRKSKEPSIKEIQAVKSKTGL